MELCLEGWSGLLRGKLPNSQVRKQRCLQKLPLIFSSIVCLLGSQFCQTRDTFVHLELEWGSVSIEAISNGAALARLAFVTQAGDKHEGRLAQLTAKKLAVVAMKKSCRNGGTLSNRIQHGGGYHFDPQHSRDSGPPFVPLCPFMGSAAVQLELDGQIQEAPRVSPLPSILYFLIDKSSCEWSHCHLVAALLRNMTRNQVPNSRTRIDK